MKADVECLGFLAVHCQAAENQIALADKANAPSCVGYSCRDASRVREVNSQQPENQKQQRQDSQEQKHFLA